MVPYAIASAILASMLLLSGFVAFICREAPLMSAFLALVILIFGLRLVFQILPPAAKSIALEAANLLLRLIFGHRQ